MNDVERAGKHREQENTESNILKLHLPHNAFASDMLGQIPHTALSTVDVSQVSFNRKAGQLGPAQQSNAS
jgi:hypothetical protein